MNLLGQPARASLAGDIKRWQSQTEFMRWAEHAVLPAIVWARDSLTQRMQLDWPDIRVQLLAQAYTTPLPHEAQRLAQPIDAPAWLRCVKLMGGGQARLYARTVIPDWHKDNPWAQVATLGEQPLGELLFTLPDITRSEFEWALNLPWPHSLANPSAQLAQIVARRCLFERQGAALLLTEVFLEPTK